jgi:hypothetical protein
MTTRPPNKREEKLSRQVARRRNRRRKIGLALIVIAAFAGIIATADWYSSTHQRPQPYVGPKPSNYQQGVLVNQSTTFYFDNEWNFLLKAGKNVTIMLTFKGGPGANVAFSMNDQKSGNLVTPYLFSAQLKPTVPTREWSGILQTDGSYRIELGSMGDGSTPVNLQVFVEAV